jgi:4,4'-diaponeurosporenoate glycosyltransferase
MFVLLVVAGLASGAWFLGRVRSPRTASAGAAEADRRDEAVSIVVPARNEATTLPVLLASLRALDPPALEVIVVDDSSNDATAGIAWRAGATVIPAGELPAGWLGKPWACHTGAANARGSHLLFLDADTWLAPDALRWLLPAQRDGGLLSVQPYHVTQRLYEEMSAYCNVVSMMGTGAFTPRPSALGSRGAFGPCLLVSAAEYARVGGHASVRADVVEDVALSARYREAGLPVLCLGGGDVVRFRMYPDGLRQLVEGWSKNLAAGATRVNPVATAATVVWVASHVAVTARLGVDAARVVRGGHAPLLDLLAATAIAWQFHHLLRRIGSFRRVTAVLFPVPLAAFLGIFGRSVVLTLLRRRVTWKGRTIVTSMR